MARASTFPLAPSVAIHSIPPVSSGYSHRLVVLPLSRALGQLCHSRPVVPAGAAALARVCGDHQFPRLHGAAGTTPLFSRGWWGLFSHSFPSCSLHGGGGGPGGSPSGGFSNFLPSGLDGERVGCSWRHLSPGRRFLSRGGRHGAARTHPCSPGFLAALLLGRAGAFSRASTSRLWLDHPDFCLPGGQQLSAPRWPSPLPARCGSCPSLSYRDHTDLCLPGGQQLSVPPVAISDAGPLWLVPIPQRSPITDFSCG